MLRLAGETHGHYCYRVLDTLKVHELDDEDLLVEALIHDICEDTDIHNRLLCEVYNFAPSSIDSIHLKSLES